MNPTTTTTTTTITTSTATTRTTCTRALARLHAFCALAQRSSAKVAHTLARRSTERDYRIAKRAVGPSTSVEELPRPPPRPYSRRHAASLAQ